MDLKDHGQELMVRLKEGDQEAFAELVRTYERLVINFAFRYLGDRALAEDVAQETFLRVYRNRKKWRPEAKFRVWLLTIVTRLCLNELRSRLRERRVLRFRNECIDEDQDLEAVDPKVDPPEIAAAKRERAEMVRKAIDRLLANQRAAVLLQHFEGLSYEEVAAVLGTTVEAVRSLLVRARRNLRKALRPLLTPGEALSEGVERHESGHEG